jgi:hypothetical protein
MPRSGPTVFTISANATLRARGDKGTVRGKIAAVPDRIEAQQVEQTIPDDIPLLELADMAVRGKVKVSPPQQRMLIEMLPFVAPKLTAVAHLREADTFARLEKCITRSNAVRHQPKLIEDLRFKRGDDPRE